MVVRLRVKIDTDDPKSSIRKLRDTAYVLGVPNPRPTVGGIC